MPRTKVVRKRASRQEPEERETNLRCTLQIFANKKKELLTKLEDERNRMLQEYNLVANEVKLQIKYKYLNMTIREIIESESTESTRSVQCISKADLLNATRTLKKERRTLKRSTSFVDDEGYLTAESVTSGGRKSRSKVKTIQSTRATRSLSRNNARQEVAAYKTPANKNTPPNTYGLVTPKCKPNTPQILLRRPKNGEVALSMQGSPLFTASVVSENMANINIPLLDGRLLTLQPQRGLRISQIPQFDPETMRQLETLRENLNKVCAASERKK